MDSCKLEDIIEGDYYKIPVKTTVFNNKTNETSEITKIESFPRVKELEEMDKEDHEQDMKVFKKPVYKRVYTYASMFDMERDFIKDRNPRILEQRTSELIRDTLNTFHSMNLADIEKIFRISGLKTMLVAIKTEGNRFFQGKKVYNNKNEECQYGYATVFGDYYLREKYYKSEGLNEDDHAENIRRLELAGHILK